MERLLVASYSQWGQRTPRGLRCSRRELCTQIGKELAKERQCLAMDSIGWVAQCSVERWLSDSDRAQLHACMATTLLKHSREC